MVPEFKQEAEAPEYSLNVAPFKVKRENLDKELAKKKLTSASSRVERHGKWMMRTLLLLDRWVTLTYFCCFTEPIGQNRFALFANVCDSNSLASQQQL